MPSSKKWDATAEVDLCMAIILANDAKAPFAWPEIHATMAELGHDFTREALSQHYSKTLLRGHRSRRGTSATPSPASTKRKAQGQHAQGIAQPSPTKKSKATK